VRSGNGVHGYWPFKEAIKGEAGRVEAALRQLADIVGGDLQVCEIARLMRLPGSHNSKRGERTPVTITHQADHRYELDDLEEWLAETSPKILRKARERGRTIGAMKPGEDYFDEYARLGYKPPIDVEKRLESMMYMGLNEASIHWTQIAVASSMIGSGFDDEEIVEVLMAATKAAAGDYGKRWNWAAEERTIRKDITKRRADVNKPRPVAKPKPAPQPTEGSNVVNMASAAAALKPKPSPKPSLDGGLIPNHIRLGQAVIDVIQERGNTMLFTEQLAHWYADGLWSPSTDRLTFELAVESEKGAKALGLASNSKLMNETRSWIQRQGGLCRKGEIPWDKHGMVPTKSGLVDPRTGEVRPMRRDDYATWRIEAEYDPKATCPFWLQVLEDVFADRSKDERVATIRVIQEILGAGLIDDKPREFSRALIFQGGSNFGKSVLLEVLGGLFGGDVNSTPIEALERPHGLMPFINRKPWVLHEAFDQRKWHLSSDVKAIITGEPVQVNIKNGPVVSQRIGAPIFWGTNHPPQFKESTKAIVNRLVVIECRREFFEENPVGAAIAAKARGLSKPSSLVLRDEMPGLLAWAVERLQRTLARGHLALTSDMTEIKEEIRRESNLVAGFLDECCAYDPGKRLAVPDFCLAFAAWFLENKGENRSVPSNEAIGKALVAMSDGRIAINPRELRDNRRRYYGGLVLNELGEAFHRAGFNNRDLQGKVANATAPDGVVNESMSEEWLAKPSIITMIERQMPEGGRTVF
jgi:P4 family phage/plasmid primase-like protien